MVRAVGGGALFAGAYLVGSRLDSALLSYPFPAGLGLLGTLVLPWAFLRLERILLSHRTEKAGS